MVTLHSYTEHYHDALPAPHSLPTNRIFFKNKRGDDSTCFEIYDEGSIRKLRLSYYIGLDWIDHNSAIYVEPKTNDKNNKTDYLKMLCSCLKHPDVLCETENLYHIQFDKPQIEIKQKQDILTPLLVVHFLQVVRVIVKKGLKKDYYSVESNLNTRVKGKILISKNLKTNILKNKPLRTVCSYQEFGFNSLENRLIKKAIRFIQRYSAFQPSLESSTSELLKFCLPVFELVDDKIELSEIKASYVNPLYKSIRLR